MPRDPRVRCGPDPADDRIEENKLRAIKGWIADPPPITRGPLLVSHARKWFTMMGATNALRLQSGFDRQDPLRRKDEQGSGHAVSDSPDDV